MQFRSTAMIAALMMVVVVFSATSRAQPSCVSELVPCGEYLNNTNRPSTECCTAITSVVQTQLTCLCNLYNNPSLFSGLGINTSQALGIPARCDLPSDTSACNATAPGASNPGGNNGSGGGNGVGTISWSAMPALFLLWAATYLY